MKTHKTITALLALFSFTTILAVSQNASASSIPIGHERWVTLTRNVKVYKYHLAIPMSDSYSVGSYTAKKVLILNFNTAGSILIGPLIRVGSTVIVIMSTQFQQRNPIGLKLVQSQFRLRNIKNSMVIELKHVSQFILITLPTTKIYMQQYRSMPLPKNQRLFLNTVAMFIPRNMSGINMVIG